MGCDVAMRFFENKVELKADTVFDFLRTAANLLLFGPFRLVQEISKKIVYLSKNELNRIFFTSVIVALLFTATNSVAQMLTGSFDIFIGKMPIALMLFCSAGLLITYCVTSSKNWTILDSRDAIDKIIMRQKAKVVEKEAEHEVENDEHIVEDSATKELISRDVAPANSVDSSTTLTDISLDSALSLDDDFLSEEKDFSDLDVMSANLVTEASEWLKENDTFVANVNSEILNDVDVKKYQRRLRGGIAELEQIGNSYDKFSDDEVKLLQQKLNAITSTDRYLSKDFINNFNNNLILDEECVLQHEVSDVGEDFTLCAG